MADGDDMDAGLAFALPTDWEADSLRTAAEALNPLPLDAGRRTGFAAEPEIDFDRIGDRLTADDDGLRLDGDGDRLGADLAKLKAHEADLKLRDLLDKAERAYDEKRFDEAWEHVQAALRIAPTNVPALLLGARCRYTQGVFEPALDLLTTARGHAKAVDQVTLVARLWEACTSGLVDWVSAQVSVFLIADRGPDAVKLVEQKVAKYPGILGLRYVLGALLFRIGRLADARDVIEAARSTKEGIANTAIATLHGAILSKLYEPEMENARKALRAGQPKHAIEHLAVCGDVLAGNQRFAWLWSYSHERYAKRSPIVGRRRARRAEVKPLDANSLQEVLIWLLTEEFDAGLAAFRKSDFDSAISWCVRAEGIDDRCGTIAYMHATAELCAANLVMRKVDLSTLGIADRRLVAAAQAAWKISADPELNKQRDELTARLSADRAEVGRLTRFITCLDRYRRFTRRYGRRRAITRPELYAIIADLRSIRAAAVASKQEHPPDSPAQPTLDQLIQTIDSTLRRLPR